MTKRWSVLFLAHCPYPFPEFSTPLLSKTLTSIFTLTLIHQIPPSIEVCTSLLNATKPIQSKAIEFMVQTIFADRFQNRLHVNRVSLAAILPQMNLSIFQMLPPDEPQLLLLAGSSPLLKTVNHEMAPTRVDLMQPIKDR